MHSPRLPNPMGAPDASRRPERYASHRGGDLSRPVQLRHGATRFPDRQISSPGSTAEPGYLRGATREDPPPARRPPQVGLRTVPARTTAADRDRSLDVL